MTKIAEILQKDEPLLRQKAKPVPEKDIPGKKIQSILNRMKKALDREDDGVAIAAPQIGENLRIFVISGRFLAHQIDADAEKISDIVFINPELTKVSKKRNTLEEGCLSVRYLYGKVSRAEKATVNALNERGERFTRGGSGILAQIFQHEMDHLEGILFIDKASDIIDMPPEKNGASDQNVTA